MARVVLTPMSPLEFPVFDQIGHASAVYGWTMGKGNLGAINLVCSGPVIRGGNVSCTASAADQSQALTVTGWSFTSSDGIRVDRALNPTDVTWSGALATDGDIVVAGKVGGISGQSQPQHVSVIPRDWQGKVALKDHQIISPSTMTSRPDSFSVLGNTEMTLPLRDAMSSSQWSVNISDEGPNNGFLYLTDVPVISTTRPQANTNALNDTSSFYRIQESRARTIKNVPYCAKSTVLSIIPDVKAHEGYDPATQPNSHSGIFRRHVDSVAALAFEPLVNPPDGSALTTRITSVLTEAGSDSRAMDHDSRNTLTMSCYFHFDYSGLR